MSDPKVGAVALAAAMVEQARSDIKHGRDQIHARATWCATHPGKIAPEPDSDYECPTLGHPAWRCAIDLLRTVKALPRPIDPIEAAALILGGLPS